MKEVQTVVIFVVSVLSMKTTEGKNMTTKAFSTCGQETYKSMSNPITCSAGYCRSLMIGRTSPSDIFNTNCRNQCPGCFKAILRMLKYKEKQMATTITPKTVTNAMTGQPLNKALSTTRPNIKVTTIQLLFIRATTAQPVIKATTTQSVNTIQQETGTNPTSPTTWNHLIVVIVLVVVILAIKLIAIVIIYKFRKNIIARCKACRSSKRHSSTSGNPPNKDDTRTEDGKLQEPENQSVPLLEKPNDNSYPRVTKGEVQRVAHDTPPITPDYMDSLRTSNGTCLQIAPSSPSPQIASSAPMASNDTAPQASNRTTSHQVISRAATFEASPQTTPNGAVPQTAPLRPSPQTANGAAPLTAPNGASPQTAPLRPFPLTAPNGASPQTAPLRPSPQTANGAAPLLSAPNGAVLQTAQLGLSPQTELNGAVPQIRSGASPQAEPCRGAPQAGPNRPLPGIVHNGVPPQVATNGNNVYQAVGSGGNLFHTTANKITNNIYITHQPNSSQHHGNNEVPVQPNIESPVQQNNEDLHHSVPEEGEKTKPNQTSDGEGSHKLTFLEQ